MADNLPDWPPLLPQRALAGTYTRSHREIVEWNDKTNPPIGRQVALQNVQAVSCDIRMTEDQFDYFEGFFYSTLRGGLVKFRASFRGESKPVVYTLKGYSAPDYKVLFVRVTLQLWRH